MFNLVIGIDISKATLDATIIKLGSNQPLHDSFLNKNLGFKQLINWTRKQQNDNEHILFCMEHTGYYSQSLCSFLDKQKLDFALINPLLIKRSMGFRREKSDKRDSEMIALYGIRFQDEIQVNNLLKDEILQLQLFLAHRKRLQKQELGLQKQDKHLMHCLSESCTKVIRADIKSLKAILKARRLKIEKHIDELINQCQALKIHFDLLVSIPGVGPITALHTIVYTHNFTQIDQARKFACYCGVVPFKNESGTSIRKGTSVSFFGNKTMKSLLNFGAMSAVKVDPELKKYYNRKVEEGKSKMAVLNAVRNKLVHRMFAVIKRGTTFVVKPVF